MNTENPGSNFNVKIGMIDMELGNAIYNKMQKINIPFFMAILPKIKQNIPYSNQNTVLFDIHTTKTPAYR